MKCVTVMLLTIAGSLVVDCQNSQAKRDQQSDHRPSKDVSVIIRQAATEGRILFRLTTPEEFKEIVGKPTREWTDKEAEGKVIFMEYPGIQAKFINISNTPYTLFNVLCEGKRIDIGQDRLVVLRNEVDLDKFEPFYGYCGADLSRLDLSQKGDLLQDMPFDSLTVWPEPDRLPTGFEPGRLLEEGKNPGLGVRSLHQEGINGRNVGMAIVDMPMPDLRTHVEYTYQLKSYREIGDVDDDAGIHGARLCSIAVGQTCGVAPGASLNYYAVPVGRPDNRPSAKAIEKILELNRNRPPSEKVRVISISRVYLQGNHYDEWREAADKAKENGILIVTRYEQDFMPDSTLKQKVGKDPDALQCYGYAYGVDGSDRIYVPISNRSTASHRGTEVYTFDPDGDPNWAVPYLAGLAALAFQVHPGISPDEIVKLWQETATRTRFGLVVNPRGFIEAIKHF